MPGKQAVVTGAHRFRFTAPHTSCCPCGVGLMHHIKYTLLFCNLHEVRAQTKEVPCSHPACTSVTGARRMHLHTCIAPATWNRTRDDLMAANLYSQMLYQLSYSRHGRSWSGVFGLIEALFTPGRPHSHAHASAGARQHSSYGHPPCATLSSGHPESNQGRSDGCKLLQSHALPN